MIKDSGERRTFDTGAQRDRQVGKGRMDLLPYRALMEVSKLFEQGAIKYESRNWEKGMPVKEFLDSGARHHAKCMVGLMDEPHLVQWCWNALCALDTYLRVVEGVLPEELMDDLPFDGFRLISEPEDNGPSIEPKDNGPRTFVTQFTGTIRSTPKIGDIYSVFHRLEPIVDVTSDHVSTGVTVYTSDEWNKHFRSGDIFLYKSKSKDNGPPVDKNITPKFPVVGECYLLFNKAWEVVRIERSDIILQCVATGALFTATCGYWKEQYKSGSMRRLA